MYNLQPIGLQTSEEIAFEQKVYDNDDYDDYNIYNTDGRCKSWV